MTWQAVASLADAERARPWLEVRVADTDMVLGRRGDDWFAVQARCTHAGCPFFEEATLEDGTIVCHCHGSQFDLRTGEVQHGPAEYPLTTYPVRVTGDQIEVDV